MSVRLNHTIVAAHDKQESAAFLADILGLPQPTPYGPFLCVQADKDVNLDFMDWRDNPVSAQHYAFLVDENDFDVIFDRIRGRDLPFWADPHKHEPGINTADGGRGVYFEDPSGHLLEILTRPYGSGG